MSIVDIVVGGCTGEKKIGHILPMESRNPHFELKVALEQCGTYGSVKDGEKLRNNKRPTVTSD